MRLFSALLLIALSVATVHAQSGVGNVRGVVLVKGPGILADELAELDGSTSTTVEVESTAPQGHPVVTLTPLATLQQDAFADPRTVDASDGTYNFEGTPMGLYRLRIEASGFDAWEAEVYVLSDSETVVNVLLRRARPSVE
ncbi:MAG: carboxypeptidase-like regulatory domain-containing protein [Bacteroidota bacterium]